MHTTAKPYSDKHAWYSTHVATMYMYVASSYVALTSNLHCIKVDAHNTIYGVY